MSQFLRHYLLAIQFFTRIPVTGRLAAWVGFSPAMLRASAAHFPGVGVVVGALVAGLTAVLLACLPHSPFAPLVAAVLGTVLSVMVTGAFHEDGLADVADGLGGSYDRDRALLIMKDSRVGAFGALVIRLMPHVGDATGSKSKPLADQISIASLLAAGMWCFIALAPVFVAHCAIDSGAIHMSTWSPISPLLVALFASSLGFAYMGRMLWRRLQGFTGDGLGATQQLCELAVYLGLALSL